MADDNDGYTALSGPAVGEALKKRLNQYQQHPDPMPAVAEQKHHIVAPAASPSPTKSAADVVEQEITPAQPSMSDWASNVKKTLAGSLAPGKVEQTYGNNGNPNQRNGW